MKERQARYMLLLLMAAIIWAFGTIAWTTYLDVTHMRVEQEIRSAFLNTYVWYNYEIVWHRGRHDPTPEQIVSDRNSAIEWAQAADKVMLDSIITIRVNKRESNEYHVLYESVIPK
jgi:hypothetical protein